MDMVILTATEDEIKEGAAAHKLKVLDEDESTEVDAEKAEPLGGAKSPTRDLKDDEPGRRGLTTQKVRSYGTVNCVKTLRGCCKTCPMNKKSQRGQVLGSLCRKGTSDDDSSTKQRGSLLMMDGTFKRRRTARSS